MVVYNFITDYIGKYLDRLMYHLKLLKFYCYRNT